MALDNGRVRVNVVSLSLAKAQGRNLVECDKGLRRIG